MFFLIQLFDTCSLYLCHSTKVINSTESVQTKFLDLVLRMIIRVIVGSSFPSFYQVLLLIDGVLLLCRSFSELSVEGRDDPGWEVEEMKQLRRKYRHKSPGATMHGEGQIHPVDDQEPSWDQASDEDESYNEVRPLTEE